MVCIRAGAWFVICLTGATDGCQLTLKKPDQFAHFGFFQITQEACPPRLATNPFDIAFALEISENVFQEFSRDMLHFSHAGNGHDRGPQPLGYPQTDQSAQGIFATFC